MKYKIYRAMFLCCSIFTSTYATKYFVVKDNTRPFNCTFSISDYCEYDTAHIWIAKDSINGVKDTQLYNWVVHGGRVVTGEIFEDTIRNQSEIYYNVGAASGYCHGSGWFVLINAFDRYNTNVISYADSFPWGYGTVIKSFVCPPEAHIGNSGNKTKFCKDECVTFLDKSKYYPKRWLWKIWHNGIVIDTANTQNYYYCFKDTGNYVIDLDVWNEEGHDRDAYISDSQLVVIPTNEKVADKHQANYLVNTTQTEFIACAIGEQYEWFPKENLSCTNCSNTVVTLHTDAKYYCIITNKNGCTDTCFYTVEIPFDIFIPTAITPNNDGVNDIFIARGINLEILNCVIYNRFGNEIYNDDLQNGWNGKYKDELVENGVYAYIITYKNLKTKEIKRKSGSITIIR